MLMSRGATYQHSIDYSRLPFQPICNMHIGIEVYSRMPNTCTISSDKQTYAPPHLPAAAAGAAAEAAGAGADVAECAGADVACDDAAAGADETDDAAGAAACAEDAAGAAA